MLDYLRDWKFWIVVCVVIIVILWVIFVFVGASGGGRRKRRSRRYDSDSDSHYRRKRSHRRTRRNYSDDDYDVKKPSILRGQYHQGIQRPHQRVSYSDTYSAEIPLPPRERKGRYHNVTSSREAIMPRTNDLMVEPMVPELPPNIAAKVAAEPVQNKKRSDSKGEIECGRALRRIYGKEFKKVRPSWLVNPKTGRCLELDWYNEELGIAVEYNGEMHYHYIKHFHRNYDGFLRQIERDNLKLEICDKMGVYVITVPYTCPLEDIEEYIRYWDPDAYAARLAQEASVYKN